MALMTLKITPVTGDVIVVPVVPKVIVAAERHFKTTMAKLFSQESMSYEAMMWLGWQAMQASGHIVKPFDDWLDGIEAIDMAGDRGESAPLGKEA
jgi:hypothetical protein